MRVTSNDILHPVVSAPRGGRYLILIAAALLLIALIDHATGDLPFQHLYYLPIIFAANKFGRRGGLLVALAAVAFYHLANHALLRLRHSEADTVQIILFITVGLIAAKLTDDAERMRLLANTDDLTGLHNLRSFEARLASLVKQARVDNTPLSLLVIDLDRLKSINDRYGRLAGAEAVRAVGRLIAEHIPPNGVACRYGGDEFVVALPEHTTERAVEFAQALRQTVYEARPTLAGRPFPAGSLSISVGAASRLKARPRPAAHEGEELFGAADRALYRAKEQGRDRVCVAAAAAE